MHVHVEILLSHSQISRVGLPLGGDMWGAPRANGPPSKPEQMGKHANAMPSSLFSHFGRNHCRPSDKIITWEAKRAESQIFFWPQPLAAEPPTIASRSVRWAGNFFPPKMEEGQNWILFLNSVLLLLLLISGLLVWHMVNTK